MRKLRLKEVKQFAQGHTDSKWWSQILNIKRTESKTYMWSFYLLYSTRKIFFFIQHHFLLLQIIHTLLFNVLEVFRNTVLFNPPLLQDWGQAWPTGFYVASDRENLGEGQERGIVLQKLNCKTTGPK